MAENTVPATADYLPPSILLTEIMGQLRAGDPLRARIEHTLLLYPPERHEPRRVLFEPFHWIREPARGATVDAGKAADFAGLARDVAAGVADIVAILERDDLDASCGDEDGRQCPALLSVTVNSNLTRLAVVSLGLLRDEAERQQDYIGKHAG